jgi:N-acetylmuramoyl-L-alanine amidase
VVLFLTAAFLSAASQAAPAPGSMPFVPDPRDKVPTPWREPGYNRFLWLQSPNWGPRPQDAVVDTIVIHSTVIPTLEATTGAFQRESSQVSAHYTIGKDGSYVLNVSTFERAWHAGVSVGPNGKRNVNDYSIGIELVNLNDGKDPYPEAQIQVLQNIIEGLRRRFPIRHLVSHEWIARPVGRKSDPTNFPWDRFRFLGLELHYGKAASDAGQ